MWARLRSWLGAAFGRRRLEQDMVDELDFHLRARTEHWQRQGLSPEAAARRARLEFGGVERHKEDCRQARGLRWVDEARSDLTYGFRTLRAAPAFTIVSVAILAIAIGANTAVFSVVEAVMLRMLPVERPQELRELAWIERRDSDWKITYDGSMRPGEAGERVAWSFSYPIYERVRDRSTTFADLFLFRRYEVTVDVRGRAQRLNALLVSGNFTRGLGVTPMLGRGLDPDDERAGAPSVAVLTHSAWQRLFGGDAAATLGRSLTVNGTPAIIVGVTPPPFYGVEPGNPIDLMLPVTTLWPAVDGAHALSDARRWIFRVMGRVNPGVDAARVQAETDALVKQALPENSSDAERPGLRAVIVNPAGQGLDSLRQTYAQPLYLLMVIMGVVLFIASANVAGLQLTRAATRDREIGLRLALGAGRARLLRQLITESALLAGIGGVLGIALAWPIRNDLLPLLNQEQGAVDVSIGVDVGLVIFSAALCAIVGLSCGVLPALRASRVGLTEVLRRTVPSGATGPLRLVAGKALITVQVALSLVLLVGAGLFTRTLLNVRSQALGFRPDHVLLFQMDATAAGYKDGRVLDFYERVLERTAGVPGVRAVALSRYGLLSGGATRDGIVLPGAPKGEDQIGVHIHFISPRYFETMGIPIVSGREFSGQDRDGAPRVAIVNQALASRLRATRSEVIGRRVWYDRPGSDVEIVGLVGDARFASLRDAAPPTWYLPYRQYPQHQMTFAARLDGDPQAAAAPIRDALDELAPDVPVFGMETQDDQIEGSMKQERVFAYAASAFGALAVCLACLGIYGTLAYSVARRTAEIGLRMALGASRTRAIAMMLRESLVPVLLGTAIGLVIAGTTTRFVESMLFGLTSHDVPTTVLAIFALIASAFVAAWLPSRRASSIDPMTALRRE